MGHVAVLIKEVYPRGGMHSGRLLEDMPPGLKFTGQRGHSFAFELSREQAAQAQHTEQPVALVDLNNLCAVDIKPGSEFPQIHSLPPTGP